MLEVSITFHFFFSSVLESLFEKKLDYEMILALSLILGCIYSQSEVYKYDETSCASKDEIEELKRTIRKLQDQMIEMQNSNCNANILYPAPEFDSGWFQMRSQDNVFSYKQIFHEFNAVPSNVKVLVRVPNEDRYGDMKGMIFEGTGSQPNDDDTQGDAYGEHGGVLFAYDKHRIKLWTPNKNNGKANGHIIYVGDGWGPKGMPDFLKIDHADVKVLAWR